MAPRANKWFAATPNTDYIFKALTDGTVTKLSGGRIPKMTPAAAAGLVGSWVIETGRRGLERLDVVEAGTGRGRGLSQYTGVRRTPYDQAVAAAKASGRDPNSAQWQVEYFAKEYMNRDLIGWTRVFESMPKTGSPADYAKYFTGSAASGTGYFRPGVPHWDRRMQAAKEVFEHYASPKPSTGQSPSQIFDPMKGIKKIFQPNSSAQGLSISPAQAQWNKSQAADFLKTPDFLISKPGDLTGPTKQSNIGRLPGLVEVAQAGIGNLGQFKSSSNSYGQAAFSSNFNTMTINNRSYGGSLDLGRSLGIRAASSAAASGGYTMPSASSSVGNAWKAGFGVN
jgi:hypothetical protein